MCMSGSHRSKRDTYRDNEPLLSRLECSWVDIPVLGSRDLLWLLLLSVCYVLQAHSRKFQGYLENISNTPPAKQDEDEKQAT